MFQLDKYIFTMKMWGKHVDYFRKCPQIQEGVDRSDDVEIYRLFWGFPSEPRNGNAGILETGFFYMAAHIDTVGLYQHSALCTPRALDEIENFTPRVTAKDVQEAMCMKTGYVSKYSQGEDKDIKNDIIEWEGVVLASQNPGDRSIRSIASPLEYYKFIEDACKYYGKELFIKLHPWNSGEIGDRIRAIANKYGARAAKVNHRIIEKCKFVLVFNSTFAVDCMIRNVPVAQYAPGYFYQNPAVCYTHWTFPRNIVTDKEFGQKTCDFLMWKYCFDHSMPSERWIEMFEHFASSREMFPMPEGLSYAGYNLRER